MSRNKLWRAADIISATLSQECFRCPRDYAGLVLVTWGKSHRQICQHQGGAILRKSREKTGHLTSSMGVALLLGFRNACGIRRTSFIDPIYSRQLLPGH